MNFLVLADGVEKSSVGLPAGNGSSHLPAWGREMT